MKKTLLLGILLCFVAVPFTIGQHALAQHQALSEVKITTSTGSILDGDVVYFQRENTEFLLLADADCYAFAFLVSPDGDVQLVFPDRGRPFNKLSANEALRAPSRDCSYPAGDQLGWSAFVVVASTDASWDYSLNPYIPPAIWDSTDFGEWKPEPYDRLHIPHSVEEGRVKTEMPTGELRLRLREEMNSRPDTRSAGVCDKIIARGQTLARGAAFTSATKRFYVASILYGDAVGDSSYESVDDDRWFVFHEPLSPYGSWEYFSGCGYAWRPYSVGRRWAPYYRGRWVFTSFGWTWVSAEPWGYITCHYGRWAFTSDGWIWLPGYTWGPAWVEWYYSDGYAAWRPAPLRPKVRRAFREKLKEIPVMVIERKDLTIERVERIAKIERLSFNGKDFILPNGTPIKRLAGPTANRQLPTANIMSGLSKEALAEQRRLASAPVKTFNIMESFSEARDANILSKIEADRLRLVKPTLRLPAARPRIIDMRDKRILRPANTPKARRPSSVKPKQKTKPKKAKPKRAKPKRAKPKKKTDKREPKKAAPKETR